MKTILFVCTGNVCRSPMAAGLMRAALNDDAQRLALCEAVGLGVLFLDPVPSGRYLRWRFRSRGCRRPKVLPACPKCGFAHATPLNCPSCKATFAKPLSISHESAVPVPSVALGKEISIDRRSAPRDGLPHPPVQLPPPPAASAFDDPWLQPPTDSKPAVKPVPKPVLPQPRPPVPRPVALTSSCPTGALLMLLGPEQIGPIEMVRL